MANLTGKAAIVSGAARGIGMATAVALARCGCNVAINDLCEEEQAAEALQACRQAGAEVRFAQGDVSDQPTVERMVDETVDAFGGLDIAVCNAAFSDRAPFYDQDMDAFRRTIDVTMWGAYYMMRAAAARMVRRGEGGSIVLVSSPHAYIPVPKSMPYNMAKAATEHMARTAATELFEHRIRVNWVYPGWTDTPGERKFVSAEEIYDQAKGLPWGRLGRPDEVARGIVFLVDPESDYITGTGLRIDGGISLPWWAKDGIRTR